MKTNESGPWHQFFRHSVPGYVFVLTVFPYYSDILLNSSPLIPIFAGFPIGIVFHWVYHAVFHIGLGEQEDMQRIEAVEILKGIKNTGITAQKDYLRISECFWYFLEEKEERSGIKEWLRIHFSIMHSLGVGSLAIFIGLLTPWIPSPFSSRELPECRFVCVWLIVWLVVIICALAYRKTTKRALIERLRISIANKKKGIDKAVARYNNAMKPTVSKAVK